MTTHEEAEELPAFITLEQKIAQIVENKSDLPHRAVTQRLMVVIDQALEAREKKGQEGNREVTQPDSNNGDECTKAFSRGLKKAVEIGDKFCTCAAETERDCYICQAAKVIQAEVKE